MADTASQDFNHPAHRSTLWLHDEPVGRALARLEGAVKRKPGFGRSTSVSTTTLVDALRCESRERDHVVKTDLTPALGGHDTGPSPSALLRAALGSCLTMGYRLRAAHHRIPVDRIRVEVETDSELAGMLDPEASNPPGFLEIRYRVEIDSPAPADVIDRLIGEADRLSPVLDSITRPVPATRLASRRVTGGGEG
ncbi:MAG: OsmC family protein [Acidimicrobiia bacterium]|nr:OsmC family protein [Acidimicrobiia bacterium]